MPSKHLIHLSLPSLAFNLSQHQSLFRWAISLHQVAKVWEYQLQHQSFQIIFRTDFLWNWLIGSPCSPRDSQESSPTPQFKCISSSVLNFLYSPTLTSIHGYWKTIDLPRWTLVGKVMSLLFKCCLGWSKLSFQGVSIRLQTSSAVILESHKIKSLTASLVSPSICLEVMELDAMILVFWMLCFKPTSLLSSFTFFKRLFS